jgi:hypothetical protein
LGILANQSIRLVLEDLQLVLELGQPGIEFIALIAGENVSDRDLNFSFPLRPGRLGGAGPVYNQPEAKKDYRCQ